MFKTKYCHTFSRKTVELDTLKLNKPYFSTCKMMRFLLNPALVYLDGGFDRKMKVSVYKT